MNRVNYRLRRIGAPATVKDVADVFILRKKITVVGRAKSQVDFFIDSSVNKALISRVHARICKIESHLFKIEDVSLNGTYVNNVKISCEALLRSGDVIVFGHMQGACLESGYSYKQFGNNEFKFMFECFHDNLTNTHTLVSVETSPTIFDNCWSRREIFAGVKMLQDEGLKAAVQLSTEDKEQGSNKTLQHSSYEACSASKCLLPDDNVLSWVQCDDCDKWYHTKCCGLTLKLLQVKNSKFHCGCL